MSVKESLGMFCRSIITIFIICFTLMSFSNTANAFDWSLKFEPGLSISTSNITLNTGAVLNGRALARIAAVTMDSNTIVKP